MDAGGGHAAAGIAFASTRVKAGDEPGERLGGPVWPNDIA